MYDGELALKKEIFIANFKNYIHITLQPYTDCKKCRQQEKEPQLNDASALLAEPWLLDYATGLLPR